MACTADRYQNQLGEACVSQPGVAAKSELCWPGVFVLIFYSLCYNGAFWCQQPEKHHSAGCWINTSSVSLQKVSLFRWENEKKKVEIKAIRNRHRPQFSLCLTVPKYFAESKPKYNSFYISKSQFSALITPPSITYPFFFHQVTVLQLSAGIKFSLRAWILLPSNGLLMIQRLRPRTCFLIIPISRLLFQVYLIESSWGLKVT